MKDADGLYGDFTGFGVDRPADGVLRLTLDAPGLNAVDADAHRSLADVWRVIDRDPDTRVALIRGAGKGFSAGEASSCSTRSWPIVRPAPGC